MFLLQSKDIIKHIQRFCCSTFVTPTARRLVYEYNILPNSIKPTGKKQKLLKGDVIRYISEKKLSPEHKSLQWPTATITATSKSTATTTTTPIPVRGSPSVQNPNTISSNYLDIPNKDGTKAIAERVTLSKHNIPHYYLSMECNVDNIIALMKNFNTITYFTITGGKISLNDFIIKACAHSLSLHPVVNSEWQGGHIRQYKNVDINFTVQSNSGVLSPVIKDVSSLGLTDISKIVWDIGVRAREGKTTQADLQMGTFSISNLDMLGISHFPAIINPPQAAILAIGGLQNRVINDDISKVVRISKSITVTLSCDHRVIDGVAGSQWLQTFKSVLENPLKLL